MANNQSTEVLGEQPISGSSELRKAEFPENTSAAGRSFSYHIILALAVLIIGGLFTGWLRSQKQDIKDDIIRSITMQTNKVSGRIDSSISEIRADLESEKEARAKLSAFLLKSGVDVPAESLVAFSHIDAEPSQKIIFTKEFDTKDAVSLEDFTKFRSRFEKGKFFKYAAKVVDDLILVAYSDKPPTRKDVFIESVVHASLVSGDGKSAMIPLNVNQSSNFIDVLQQDGVKASNITFVPEKKSK